MVRLDIVKKYPLDYKVAALLTGQIDGIGFDGIKEVNFKNLFGKGKDLTSILLETWQDKNGIIEFMINLINYGSPLDKEKAFESIQEIKPKEAAAEIYSSLVKDKEYGPRIYEMIKSTDDILLKAITVAKATRKGYNDFFILIPQILDKELRLNVLLYIADYSGSSPNNIQIEAANLYYKETGKDAHTGGFAEVCGIEPKPWSSFEPYQKTCTRSIEK